MQFDKKNLLRQQLRQTRQLVAQSSEKQIALASQVDRWLMFHSPSRIGFYWPIQGEFDMRPNIENWLKQSPKRISALPVIEPLKKILIFHEWQPNMPLKNGLYHIPIPEQSKTCTPEVIFIPCVGFNQSGFRLGYGGGFYDQTLANWENSPQPITVGIAYQANCTEIAFQESHDYPLHYILTDLNCYSFHR